MGKSKIDLARRLGRAAAGIVSAAARAPPVAGVCDGSSGGGGGGGGGGGEAGECREREEAGICCQEWAVPGLVRMADKVCGWMFCNTAHLRVVLRLRKQECEP